MMKTWDFRWFNMGGKWNQHALRSLSHYLPFYGWLLLLYPIVPLLRTIIWDLWRFITCNGTRWTHKCANYESCVFNWKRLRMWLPFSAVQDNPWIILLRRDYSLLSWSNLKPVDAEFILTSWAQKEGIEAIEVVVGPDILMSIRLFGDVWICLVYQDVLKVHQSSSVSGDLLRFSSSCSSPHDLPLPQGSGAQLLASIGVVPRALGSGALWEFGLGPQGASVGFAWLGVWTKKKHGRGYY